MNKAPITAILLHKNAHESLEKAVESVHWCKEIIIIDDESHEPPQNIAKKYQAILMTRKLTSFSDQRNYAMHLATQPWIFFLDADEIVSDQLQSEMRLNITKHNTAGFLIPRQDQFMGKILYFGETSSLLFLRLAKKGAGQWSRDVHERWEVQGGIGVLHAPLLHKPHLSLSSFLEKIDRYTELEADERKKNNKSFSLFELFVYPIAKFIYNYVFRFGFLDGFPGLCMAYMMSLHSLIIRIKMYE